MIGTATPGAGAPALDALARVVHDLHGPLTVIRGLCATLVRDEPRADRRRALDMIDAEALRLAEGLRGIARREPVSARPAPPACDLVAAATSVAERFAAPARARGIGIVVRARRPSVRVAVGPAEVERILENLVRNGLRHGKADGTLTLGVAVRAGRGEVRVRDDGPGVPAADRERIFGEGERGSAPVGPGRGLGLAIARDLADAGAGRLTLDPVGAGACFRLALPLAPEAPEGPGAA